MVLAPQSGMAARTFRFGMASVAILGAMACGDATSKEGSGGEGGGGTQEAAVCLSDAQPEFILEGRDGSASHSPRLPSMVAHESGTILFANSDFSGEAWLAEPSGPVRQLDEDVRVESSRVSPGGRWMVVGYDSRVTIFDFETQEELELAERISKVEFFRDSQGEEGIVLSGERLMAVTVAGIVDLGAVSERIVVAALAPRLVSEDDGGRRVIDLETGESRDLVRGEGVVELSRDGEVITYQQGRSAGDSPTTIEVINADDLSTIAELPYSPGDGGYYRRPEEAITAGHTFAIHRPGGGVTIFDDDNQIHETTRGEMVALLGTHHALVREGSTLALIDVETDATVELSGVDDTTGMPLGSFGTVFSRRRSAAGFVADVQGVPCVVRASANDMLLETVVCDEPDGYRSAPVWVGDDGSVLLGEWLDLEETRFLELHQPGGEGWVSERHELAYAQLAAERENLLWLSGAGSTESGLLEVDLESGQLRVLVTADKLEVGVAGQSCVAAVALGCLRSTGVPDSGPLVDWQIHRVPIGATMPPIDGCPED